MNPCPKPEPRVRGRKTLNRGKRINPENTDRVRDQWAIAYHSEAFCAWLRSLNCAVGGCLSARIEVAHAKSRGAGGTWKDCLPLCTRHHESQHSLGIETFEKKVGFRLADAADKVHGEWKIYSNQDVGDVAR